MQKTAYELRISDWSSDVCSSDLPVRSESGAVAGILATVVEVTADVLLDRRRRFVSDLEDHLRPLRDAPAVMAAACERSEEHTSELQSLMRISYAVFCLKKNTMTPIS